MNLQKYDRNLILLIIVSSFGNFLAHLYDYGFYNGNFVINTFSSTFDVPEHLAYTMEILRGKPPFQNPLAAGFTINYPIGLPLLIAVFTTITGIPVLQVFRVFSIFLNIFIGLIGYIMVSSFLKNKRIGFYTTFFLLFSGGFFWTTYLFPILGLGENIFLYEFFMADYIYYPSLISVNLFRPLSRTFGFGLFCFYFYFLNLFLKSKKIKYILLNGFLLGLLLNTSPGMIIELFILSIMAILYFKMSLNNILKYFITLIISMALFSIPLSLGLVIGVLTGEAKLLSSRYLLPIFYLPFFGISFVFMIIGLLFYPLKEKKMRKFLLLWLIIALFLANIPLIGTTFQIAIFTLLMANTHIFTLLLNIPVYIFSSLGLVKILNLQPNSLQNKWHVFKDHIFSKIRVLGWLIDKVKTSMNVLILTNMSLVVVFTLFVRIVVSRLFIRRFSLPPYFVILRYEPDYFPIYLSEIYNPILLLLYMFFGVLIGFMSAFILSAGMKNNASSRIIIHGPISLLGSLLGDLFNVCFEWQRLYNRFSFFQCFLGWISILSPVLILSTSVLIGSTLQIILLKYPLLTEIRRLKQMLNVYNFKRYGIPLLLIFCCISTFLLVILRGYEDYAIITKHEYKALMWVRENTEEEDIFLTFHFIDIEVSRITGTPHRQGRGQSWVTIIGERRVILNLKGIFLSRGIDHNEVVRIASEIDLIYNASNMQKTIQLIKSYPITYIYVGPDELEQYGDAVNKFENQKYFETVYFNDLVKIYRLK